MAKFETPFPDTQELFQGVLDNTELEQVLSIDLVTNNKLNTVGKVSKTNAYTKHKTKVDIYVELNEEVFEKLDEFNQLIVLESLVCSIEHNAEKDTVKINKPDISIHSGVGAKYGKTQTYDNALLVKEVFAQLKEQKEDEPEPVAATV